ncbi:MAG: tetratricopeptide repeat protein [Methylococcaceae bacterium]
MLERKVLRLLYVILFALCFVIPVSAQMIPPGAGDTGLGGVNTITGTVLAAGQRFERHVTVRLQTMTKGDRVVMTDDYGNFAFRGLISGDYTIVIDKEKDFQPFSQVVSIIQPRGFPPQTYTLSIRLEFKGRTDAKPGVLNAEFANVPKPALVHFNNAVEQAKKNDYPGAIEQLKLAIKEYPSFMLAFNELGVQYLKLNQLENADEAFQGALKIAPDAFAALINRGIANVLMKRYGEAVPILRKALKKNDQSAVGHYFLGQALANLGLFEDAEKELLASLELGKEEMKEAHRVLAIIYTSRGAKKQAADELEAYLKLAPDAPDAEKLKDKIRQLKESNE